MPSSMHEGYAEMFRRDPSVVPKLLTEAFGVTLPGHDQVCLESGDLTQSVPTEYRADAVVGLVRTAARVLAVVVEVQLGRDGDKRWSWPVYLTTVRARLRCPVVLLVVCVDPRTAKWCAAPIDVGHPGWILRPLVMGPDQIPFVTDPEQARRSPELAVLSAMAHANRPDWHQVAQALLAALVTLDEDRRIQYSGIVWAALPRAARRTLEAMLTAGTYEYQNDFARHFGPRWREEGRAQGR